MGEVFANPAMQKIAWEISSDSMRAERGARLGREAKFIGRIGAELDVQTGRQAAYLAALNGLAVARQHLGSLDKVTRIVRLGVLVATSGDVREQPIIADGASELLQDVFGKDKNPSRLVYGVASLPLGVPVELELIFEVSA